MSQGTILPSISAFRMRPWFFTTALTMKNSGTRSVSHTSTPPANRPSSGSSASMFHVFRIVPLASTADQLPADAGARTLLSSESQ
jgi:hypothetical protein